MKLTIDTKEDSHEDIRKVIKMLQHLVSEGAYSNQGNLFSDDSPSNDFFSDVDSSPTEETSSEETPTESAAPTNAFSAMFGDNSAAPSAESSSQETSLNEEKPKKLDLDSEMIPY